MDTVQSFFHRMTAQESFSFLQIFDDFPCLIIKFSVLEIILFIFFCNLFYHTARISHGNAPVRNIFCHDASCSDNHITSDMYPRHNNRVSAKPYIITDRYLNPIFISRISCCRMNWMTSGIIATFGAIIQFSPMVTFATSIIIQL